MKKKPVKGFDGDYKNYLLQSEKANGSDKTYRVKRYARYV